jgi:DNA polymerase III delta subunit
MIKRYSLQQMIPGQMQSIYIFSSQDPDIAQFETQNIIQKVQIQVTEKYYIQSLADWDIFKKNSLNYDLFSEPKAYIIQLDKSGMPNKDFIELIPGDDDIYIIHTSQFKHAFLEYLAQFKNCYWYGIYTPSPKELWHWFSQNLIREKYQFTSDIASWFQMQDELSFRHYLQMIEQIHLNFPNPITLQLASLQNFIGHFEQNDWQPLVDAWMNNDKQLISQKCQRIAPQQDLSLLIWILNRNLQVWHALVMGKQSPANIYQNYKIWNKQIPLFERSYSQLKIDKINHAICLLQAIDSDFKSYRYLSAKLKLEQLLLGFPYE